MVVNELKTQMMVINGTSVDRYDFTVSGVVVKDTKSYIYLGSPFTENGKLSDVIKLHVKSRSKDLNKFKIFCMKNETMPFLFKKTVLEATITSSLLYGSETWLTNNLKDVEKLYIGAVKSVLGVRETTRSDAVLIEAGMPSLKELTRKRTLAFMRKELLEDRAADTPLIRIYKICEAKRTGGFRFLNNVLNPTMQNNISEIEKFKNLTTSKVTTYKKLNPELSVHEVYTTRDYIDERERLIFTRFRLSSHHLKIETGRWARIAAENRECGCGGGLQDEEHVLFDCRKTEEVRRMFGIDGEELRDVGVLMNTVDVKKLVSFVYNCMKFFK